MTKGIIFYTDSRLDSKIALPVQEQLKSIGKKTGIPIVSASLKPMADMGENICLPLQPGHLTMFRQILAALEASEADIIFFCEHDVLYHPSHFDFIPPKNDVYYYNVNWWRVHLADGFAAAWDAPQVSGLCAHRDLLLGHYRKRVAVVEKYGYSFRMGFEPGARNTPESVAARNRMPNDIYIDDICIETRKSEYPLVDIRHGKNTSRAKEKRDPADFRSKTDAGNFRTGICPEWAKNIIDKMRE